MDEFEGIKVISFTDNIELDFDGNVLKNAICLGDVDNDGLNELIIGNDKGNLAIFKDDIVKPLYIAKLPGMISALAVGDILNIAHNVLVVITGCGNCYVYDCKKESCAELEKNLLVPCHTQRIPANVKLVLIADINGDGFSEMVFALTDRVVRTYRWVNACERIDAKLCGKFVGLNKWEFADQIGTIAINKSSTGEPCILVTQPGGIFITLKVDPQYQNLSDDMLDESSGAFLTKISFTLDILHSSKLRNCEICGNINILPESLSQESLPFAVVTLDGTILLVKDSQTLWNHKVHHELFAVTALDIDGDGWDEIIACGWDGFTFIMNHNQECVQYIFKEPVNTFIAGLFGFKNKSVPCLVYVTFSGMVYIYYDISIPSYRNSAILEILKGCDEYQEIAESFGIDLQNAQQFKELNNFALYGFR